MEIIRRFEVKGLETHVVRADFDGRIVDFWSAESEPTHLIITHDGQHIFERGTSLAPDSWHVAETATNVFQAAGLNPPLIIALHNSSTDANPLARAQHLIPEASIRDGVAITEEKYRFVGASNVSTDSYLDQIVTEIAPSICALRGLQPNATAILGASLGGLAALYGMARYPNYFGAALAFSPHWHLGGLPLGQDLISRLPAPGQHKIWMSRGTDELDSKYQPTQEIVDQQMRSLGWSEDRFASFVFDGDQHDELSWQRRVQPALEFWLNTLN